MRIHYEVVAGKQIIAGHRVSAHSKHEDIGTSDILTGQQHVFTVAPKCFANQHSLACRGFPKYFSGLRV